MSSSTQGLELGTKSATAAEGPVQTTDNEKMELRRVECFLTESLFKRMLRRMFPDQRKTERFPVPPLVGYLGTADSSEAYPLGDISMASFFLLTDERWLPGTEMPITLQSRNFPAGNERDTFTVQATVVRCGKDGVAFSIVLSEENSQAAYGNPLRVQWVTSSELESYLKRLKGQADTQPLRIEACASTESAAGSRLRPDLKPALKRGR